MTWEEYLARLAQTRGPAEICGRIENIPPGWAQQLRAALREAERRAELEPEAEHETELEAG
jgi:hypothetical protein